MFNWLKNKAGSSRYVGIDSYEDGFAMAVVEQHETGSPRVVAVRWCPLQAGTNAAGVLANAVRELDIRGTRVCATLPHAAYSLVQLESPGVGDGELREAMRWRVKDLIDFPVEQAVIDVFPLPESHRPGAPSLVYVVVAQSAHVDALTTALGDAGLEIEAIDIVEMAIRNLSLHFDRPGRPRAYLHLQSGQSVIEIADGSQVYLSRRVMQEFEADADPVVLQAQMENLALEVQRSLDYFESQYALGPADRLSVMVCAGELYDAFTSVAASFLTVPTERFDFDAVDIAADVHLPALGRGVTAIGTAMRGVPWAA